LPLRQLQHLVGTGLRLRFAHQNENFLNKPLKKSKSIATKP
jgi:hypothetical protein